MADKYDRITNNVTQDVANGVISIDFGSELGVTVTETSYNISKFPGSKVYTVAKCAHSPPDIPICIQHSHGNLGD